MREKRSVWRDSKMSVKKHLVGGTLRAVMVEEVRRVMALEGHIDRAAVVLGITPRTLRVWLAKWPELAGVYRGAMEQMLDVKPVPKRGRKKKDHGTLQSETNSESA